MSAKLLSGKEVSEAMLAKVLEDAEALIADGVQPKLAIMRVGADPGSISYEKSIIKRMGNSKIEVESVEFPVDVTQEEFVGKLRELNGDKDIHAVLIFKPLPEQLDEEEIKYALSPEKDPDALNPTNLGKLMIADETEAMVALYRKETDPDLKRQLLNRITASDGAQTGIRRSHINRRAVWPG